MHTLYNWGFTVSLVRNDTGREASLSHTSTQASGWGVRGDREDYRHLFLPTIA
jgi:hypothetical protein